MIRCFQTGLVNLSSTLECSHSISVHCIGQRYLVKTVLSSDMIIGPIPRSTSFVVLLNVYILDYLFSKGHNIVKCCQSYGVLLSEVPRKCQNFNKNKMIMMKNLQYTQNHSSVKNLSQEMKNISCNRKREGHKLRSSKDSVSPVEADIYG